MTRVILSLQATHTALEALRRNELSCAVAAQVPQNRRAAAKPEKGGGPFLPSGTSAYRSWLPSGGKPSIAFMVGSDQGKDLDTHLSLTLDASFIPEGGP